MATGSLKQAFAHPAERVTVRRDAPQTSGGNGGFIAEQVEAYDEEDDDGLVAIGGWGSGDGTMPGKELIKRMKEVSSLLVLKYTKSTWIRHHVCTRAHGLIPQNIHCSYARVPP